MTSPSAQGAPRQATARVTAVTGAVAGASLAVFGALLLLVASAWEPLTHLDAAVARDLNDVVASRPWLVDTLEVATDTFAPWVFRVAGLVVAIALLLRGLPRLALWVFVTVWGGGLLVTLTKLVTARERPHVPDEVSDASGFAFPSGHAFGATVGCAVLLALAWPLLSRTGRVIAAVAGVTITLLTSFTRVALGVHYTSDVVAGIALGLAWFAASIALFRPWATRPERTARDHRGSGPRDTRDVW